MGVSKEERARQFLPFNALTGYYEMILEKQRATEPRKELSPDEIEALSAKLNNLHPTDTATVTYYDTDAYVVKTGVVTDVDFEFRTLTLLKTKIPFEDIFRIEKREDILKSQGTGQRR